MRALVITLTIGATALALAACASSASSEPTAGTTVPASTLHDQTEPLVGVVTAVDGNLEGVDSFTIRVTDGSDVTFVPDDDARFDNGPFSHIRDHLASGFPVRVDYVVADDGSYLALGAGDA